MEEKNQGRLTAQAAGPLRPETLRDLRTLVDYAYENGFHEMGYDPVGEVNSAYQAMVMDLAVGEWVYAAALGEPVADFAESFGPVRDVLDHRSVLTGLIGNLCEIVEAFARPSDQSAWTQGVLEEAHEVLLKESRAAFGRSGPCAPPVVLDGEPQVNPAEPAPTALESLPKTAAQGEEK